MNRLSTDFSTLPITKGKEIGWRIRAKLMVRPGPKIGLFKPGTHEVEDLIDCPDHHPKINEALRVIRAQSFIPYNEDSLTGDLRTVQLTVERQSNKVQLVLVSNGQSRCDALADALAKAYNWHSIWINIQEGSTNALFGPTWILHSGAETLQDLGAHFHPACFIQANIELFETVLQDLKEALIPQKNVTEFYAGVGVIGLHIAAKCKSASLIEINPYAEKCFYLSNPPKHLTFTTGPTADHVQDLQEVLIVDPPRKGLDQALLSAIETSQLEQILYLSCNEKTLKEDLAVLFKWGWKIEQVKRYDLFPNTPHIETLVDLRRSL